MQFSSVAPSCPTLCDPMDCSTPGLPVHHQLPEFTQTHVHRVGDAIQPSHPLLSPSSSAPNPSQHQSLFQWVSFSCEVGKVLEFQLYHHSFQRTPRTAYWYLIYELAFVPVFSSNVRWSWICYQQCSKEGTLAVSSSPGLHFSLMWHIPLSGPHGIDIADYSTWFKLHFTITQLTRG